MKICFELPPGMEIRNVELTETSMTWEVVPFKRQPTATAGVLTVTGAQGLEAKTVLLASLRTGEIRAQSLDKMVRSAVDFDLPPTEYAAKKETWGKPAPKKESS